jgi:hypothetical protein
VADVAVVDPHVPLIRFIPPRVRLPTAIFNPAPTLAVAPLMDKFPATEVPVDIDFAPLIERIRLLYARAATF